MDCNALILSVGGSPPPLVESIRRQRPRYLIFFASPQTRADIDDKVLPALPGDYRPLGIERIITRSAELLDESYRCLEEELPQTLSRLGMSWGDLRVDFTGGTKAMSAALVLALAGKGCEFSYAGGADEEARDKGGVGVVVDGKEKLFLRADPWQRIAAAQIRVAAASFGRGRYELALAQLPPEISLERGRSAALVKQARGLFEAFLHWDRHRYREAHERMRQALPGFRAFADGSGDPRYLKFADEAEMCAKALAKVRDEWERFAAAENNPRVRFDGIDCTAIPRDLCATAVRRARLGDDPEDGVMFLYAAVEKLARGCLRARHGIDNSACPLDRLPEGLRDAVLAAPGKDTVELPLRKSYQLLAELNDPVGLRARENERCLEALMWSRNHCWREHAYSHVSREAFESLLPRVLSFLGCKETELTRFPVPDNW